MPEATPRATEIAVIASAGRFPGAADVQSWWTRLCDGAPGATRLDAQELHAAGVAPERIAHPDYVPVAYLLEDADRFDARFFGYTPREARCIDPQQRVLLECAWEALQRAGYGQGQPLHAGVYVGCSLNTYLLNTGVASQFEADPVMALMCSDKDFLATRIGYKLALQGPCVTVQSACSTSLVALHSACQALLAHECDMALAGGACVKVPQRAGYLYREGGMLSRDGTCRPFDADASGTVFGSGAGIVVLKRHLDALADGDDILAVIAGTAINNDGNRKASYTAPSVEGISEVVRQALEFADLPPHAVGYVECHGTGTALGDPIEVRALRAALGGDEARHPGCLLGSVKGHVGHLESAAGIAGFIKAVCCVGKAWLPPTLHFRQPNPMLGIQDSFLQVVGPGRPWADARPRVAAVVSLGVGGTNATALVREAMPSPPRPTACRWHVLPCSARSREALQAQLDAMRTLSHDASPGWLADASWTLSGGRQAHAWRAAWVVDGHRGQAVLIPPREVRPGRATTLCLPAAAPAHPCGEPLWASLAAALRSEIDRTAGAARSNGAGAASLRDFVARVATARWWHALGVTPARTVADGLGSLAAAYLDGAWNLEQVLKTIADAAAGDCELLHAEPSGLHVAEGLPRPPRTVRPLPPQQRVESIAELRSAAPDAAWITLADADGTLADPDDDGQEAPDASGRLPLQLARAWTQGVVASPAARYAGERRRRISILPVAALNRDRHWW